MTSAYGDVPTGTMRASVLLEANRIELQERPVPDLLPDEVLVQVGSVGVCGSDVHYYREGRIGPFVVDGPLVLGHEVGGRIVAVGSDVPKDRVGERVAIEPQRPCRRCAQCKAGRYNLCPDMEFYATPPIDGAFCDYVTAPADFAHPVPDTLSDEATALLEPLSVGIAAARKGRIVPNDRVLIAGGGPIGVIAAQAARAFGAREVIVSDPVESRRQMAMEYGATGTVDPGSEDTSDYGVDCFIDACGFPKAIVAGIESVRGGGTVVLVGTGFDTVELPIPTVMNNELSVTGIFRYTDTWPLAAHLVASGQVKLDSLVTGRWPLEQAEDALNGDKQPGSLKSVVTVTPA